MCCSSFSSGWMDISSLLLSSTASTRGFPFLLNFYLVTISRMSILLFLFVCPSSQVWDIKDVIRLQSHAVPPDALYLVWQDDILLTAPQYSGVIQVIDTEREREAASLSGSIRRIDSLAAHRRLCATGEGKTCRLWSLGSSPERVGSNAGLLAAFVATKTFLTALSLNDALLASGSSSGIVKLWDLKVSFFFKKPALFY